MVNYQSPRGFTERDWGTLKNVFDHRCVKCGIQERKGKPLHADHIRPYSKQGSNEITNIQPLCAKCNNKKGNREEIDYRRTFYKHYPFVNGYIDLERYCLSRVRLMILVMEIMPGTHLDVDYKNIINFFDWGDSLRPIVEHEARTWVWS